MESKFKVGDTVYYKDCLYNIKGIASTGISNYGNYIYDLVAAENKCPDEHAYDIYENYLSPAPMTFVNSYIPYAMPTKTILDSNPLLMDMSRTFNGCLEIAIKKNQDYAGTGDPFKNFRGSEFVKVDPKRAILVRTMDKISRISNLIDTNAQVKNESINDTLDDAINYLAILKSYINNEKKA